MNNCEKCKIYVVEVLVTTMNKRMFKLFQRQLKINATNIRSFEQLNLTVIMTVLNPLQDL